MPVKISSSKRMKIQVSFSKPTMACLAGARVLEHPPVRYARVKFCAHTHFEGMHGITNTLNH